MTRLQIAELNLRIGLGWLWAGIKIITKVPKILLKKRGAA